MTIPRMLFGRTSHLSSRVIFGAAALAPQTQTEADQTLEMLLRYGINHIDVAAGYGDAELRLAPWMAHYRTQFFLATKTGQRTAQAAKEELHRSLERMQVDYVDLWQFHGLVDPIEWDIALSPGGAIEAAIEAKAQGLVKAIGITGHGTQIAATHRRSLERFDFDSVLLPYNYLTMQRSYYRENFNALVATCQQRNVAVQTIKSVAQRHWMGREKTTTTWYQALETQADVDLAVHWALSRPEIFVITASDALLAAKMLDAADRFDASQVPTDEMMQQMVERVGMEPLFV